MHPDIPTGPTSAPQSIFEPAVIVHIAKGLFNWVIGPTRLYPIAFFGVSVLLIKSSSVDSLLSALFAPVLQAPVGATI